MTREDFDKEMNLLLKLGHSRIAVFLSTHDQAQRQEIARLKAELTKACATARAMEKIENQHAVTIMALRQEIARLREALRAFTKCIDAHQQREQSGLLRDDMWEAYEQAQAVLAANRSKGGACGIDKR